MIAKKIAYAVLGTVMILAAALARIVSEGGPEVLVVMVMGLMTLVASADLPQQKGRTR